MLGDRSIPGPAAAALGLVVAVLPLRVGLASVFPLASHPALGHGAGIGPLAALDLVVLGISLRLAMRWLRPMRRPTLGPAALGIAIVVGAAATVRAGYGDTAFLRLGAYLTMVGLAATIARPEESLAAVRSFVGVAVGQAVAALVGVTDTIATGLPLGRYIGTYGDPFQFGIAMAAAALIVAEAPRMAGIGGRIRWPLVAFLLVALLGSNTRGAWGATLVAGIAIIALRQQRTRSQPWLRFLFGFILGASLVSLAAAVTIAAPALGLNPVSTRIRIDSITDTWRFFVQNPLSPQGLGNYPAQLPAYNTILALSVALTPLFALALAVFAITSVQSASDLAERGLFGALVAFCAATLTENIVYAGSAATVSWLLLSGLAVSLRSTPIFEYAGSERRTRERAPIGPALTPERTLL